MKSLKWSTISSGMFRVLRTKRTEHSLLRRESVVGKRKAEDSPQLARLAQQEGLTMAEVHAVEMMIGSTVKELRVNP